jgi:hypothetical protein
MERGGYPKQLDKNQFLAYIVLFIKQLEDVMTTHEDYLNILSAMTLMLPAIGRDDLEQATEHAMSWRECEECRRDAATDKGLAQKEIGFVNAHYSAFPNRLNETSTVKTLSDKPAGDLMLILCFKRSDRDTREADALAEQVLGHPGS